MFVVSFYSYKGGVGRTATLLNTAWYMALRGRRIALLDLDLEAPGLSSAYLLQDPGVPIMDSGGSVEGFFELVNAYRDNNQRFPNEWYKQYLIQGLGPEGRIGLMAAGNTNNVEYERFIQSFSWHQFYTREFGGVFMIGITQGLAALGYEYLLIDARTGVTDVSHITTLQLPDLAVLVTNLTRQSLDGIARRIDIIEECNKRCRKSPGCDYRKPGYEMRPVEIIVAASPLPRGEWRTRQERITYAEKNILSNRRIDIEVDYLDLLAVGEQDQILFRRMDARDLNTNTFLAAATQPYQRLGEEIARRNPESPENLIEDGTRLWEMGLWRIAKAHHDEAMERIYMHTTQFSRWTVGAEKAPIAESNPTFQEAELGWLLADLEALDPDKERERLEQLDAHPPATKAIEVQRARAWLALAFPYILLNRFQDSAKAASKASDAFSKLLVADTTNRQLEDLYALALLRSGYACMLSFRWDLAAKLTQKSRTIYRRLAARPLLLSLASCQLARIELAIGAEGAMARAAESISEAAAFIPEGRHSPDPSGIARSTEILSQHVRADFYHARALARYEQGRGTAADEDFEQSCKLYGEDDDAVGQLDLLVLQLSLGMRGFEVGEQIKFFDRSLDEWILVANELRVRSSAWRLELARWGLRVAQGLSCKAVEAGLKDLLSEVNAPGNKDTDPALPSLIRLERTRFFLRRGGGDDATTAQELLKSVEAELERPLENESPDIAPEVTHPLLLLRGVLAVAQPDYGGPELIDELQTAAKRCGGGKYHTREAQLRLVLALLNPNEHLEPLAHVLNRPEGIEAPGNWPWTLPIVFVFNSKNTNLEAACNDLKNASTVHEGLYDRIWRGSAQDAP